MKEIILIIILEILILITIYCTICCAISVVSGKEIQHDETCEHQLFTCEAELDECIAIGK